MAESDNTSGSPSMVSPSGVEPYVRGSYATSGSQLVIDKWNDDNGFEK